MTRIGRLKRRAEFWPPPPRTANGWRQAWSCKRVKTIPNSTSTDIRLGFTASRKVGNAVLRNRARRRLKAAAAEVLRDAQVAAPGTDLVLIARPATVARDYKALLEDFRRGLKKLGVTGATS